RPRRLVARRRRRRLRSPRRARLRQRAPAVLAVHLGHHREAQGHPPHHRRLPDLCLLHDPHGLRSPRRRHLLVHRPRRLGHRPLPNGATVVMYEGAPNQPGPDRFWSMIGRWGVTVFYTAPTAIRAFMRWGDEHPAKHDLSSLRLLGSVGEPINPEAWMWYRKAI